MRIPDLQLEIQRVTGVDGKTSGRILRTILSAITRELRSGGHVTIRRFGSFRPYTRASYLSHNVEWGCWAQRPAKRRVRFSPSRDLQWMLNGVEPTYQGESTETSTPTHTQTPEPNPLGDPHAD